MLAKTVLALMLALSMGLGVVGWVIAEDAATTREAKQKRAANTAWFTTDDGKTWFADDAQKIPPFEKDGKEAVRVFVFTCDDGKTHWAGYLQKYSPEAKRVLERGEAPANVDEILMKGTLFKNLGDEQWVSVEQPAELVEIQRLECSGDGRITNLRPVDP
jgi:hypothetical protein